LSQPRRSKPIHGDGATALTPASCGTAMQPSPSENDLLCQEISHLHKRIQAQSHALKQMRHTIRFVLNTLGKPMHVKGTRKPAKKGKL
jgi:hypothetical protein